MSCLLFCCRFGLRERIFIGRNKSEASLSSLLFSGSNSEAFCNYHGTTSLKAISSATPDRNRKKEVASIQGASVSFWNALHGAAQNLNEENKIAARRLHADTRSPDWDWVCKGKQSKVSSCILIRQVDLLSHWGRRVDKATLASWGCAAFWGQNGVRASLARIVSQGIPKEE